MKVLGGLKRIKNVVGDRAIEVAINGLFHAGVLCFSCDNTRLHNAKEAAAAIKRDGRLKLRGLAGWVWFNGVTQKYELMAMVDRPPDYQVAAVPFRRVSKVGQNEKCPCGSGKKWKKCCGK